MLEDEAEVDAERNELDKTGAEVLQHLNTIQFPSHLSTEERKAILDEVRGCVSNR